MTVAEIQNEVIWRLGAGARTNATNLIKPIDEANKKIYSKLVKVHERLFYGTDTFNATSGKSEYTVSDGVPTDIKKILHIETRYAGQAIRYPAREIKIANIDKFDYLTTSYQDKYNPKYYWFGNGATTTIGFIPTHDTTGDDYNKIWYLKQPTEITLSSQTPIVPVDAHYLIVQYALGIAQLGEDEDVSSYMAFMARWDKDVAEWIESEIPGTSEPRFTTDAESGGEV